MRTRVFWAGPGRQRPVRDVQPESPRCRGPAALQQDVCVLQVEAEEEQQQGGSIAVPSAVRRAGVPR
eukprot:3880451-Lingulodinium_polyedra.AAC.1